MLTLNKAFTTWQPKLLLLCMAIGLHLNNASQPVWAQEVIAAGASTVAIPVSKADHIQLQLDNAQFADWQVKKLDLDARTIDFQAGTLRGVTVRFNDGVIERLPVERFELISRPLASGAAVSFDAFQLVNFQRLMLRQPITTDVHVTLSEVGLNQYFSSPETIAKLEQALTKQTGTALAQFRDVKIGLSRGNQVRVDLNLALAGLMQAPMTLLGKLEAQNGTMAVNHLRLESNGNPFPFDVSGILTEQFNKLVDVKRFTKKSGIALNVQQVHFTGSTLTLNGTAQVNKLSFGSGG
ncbi:MAG: LmeA family phospholipid-binding protein [Vampirovibrionales bacterium]|nr:LmeA family phospholipid-binding protein [Vampirovibrionales bacterium]